MYAQFVATKLSPLLKGAVEAALAKANPSSSPVDLTLSSLTALLEQKTSIDGYIIVGVGGLLNVAWFTYVLDRKVQQGPGLGTIFCLVVQEADPTRAYFLTESKRALSLTGGPNDDPSFAGALATLEWSSDGLSFNINFQRSNQGAVTMGPAQPPQTPQKVWSPNLDCLVEKGNEKHFFKFRSF